MQVSSGHCLHSHSITCKLTKFHRVGVGRGGGVIPVPFKKGSRVISLSHTRGGGVVRGTPVSSNSMYSNSELR